MEWLYSLGYSRSQASDITLGNCPRHLPVLLEAYRKFGSHPLSELKREEWDGCYQIKEHDGYESVCHISAYCTDTCKGWEPDEAKKGQSLPDVEIVYARKGQFKLGKKAHRALLERGLTPEEADAAVVGDFPRHDKRLVEVARQFGGKDSQLLFTNVNLNYVVSNNIDKDGERLFVWEDELRPTPVCTVFGKDYRYENR